MVSILMYTITWITILSNIDVILFPHPFGYEITSATLTKTFSSLKTWEDRYRQLIILSKRLPILPASLKTTEMALIDCNNRVWFGHQQLLDGTLHFYGDSESRVVRGLLAIFLTAVERKTPQQLALLSPLKLFDDLNLSYRIRAIRTSRLEALTSAVHAIYTCYL